MLTDKMAAPDFAIMFYVRKIIMWLSQICELMIISFIASGDLVSNFRC